MAHVCYCVITVETKGRPKSEERAVDRPSGDTVKTSDSDRPAPSTDESDQQFTQLRLPDYDN